MENLVNMEWKTDNVMVAETFSTIRTIENSSYSSIEESISNSDGTKGSEGSGDLL